MYLYIYIYIAMSLSQPSYAFQLHPLCVELPLRNYHFFLSFFHLSLEATISLGKSVSLQIVVAMFASFCVCVVTKHLNIAKLIANL